ncbi:MAG: hypothetical protein K6F94_03585 [Bacteroidaceae bacterium]|nr:hypothetical protein [Bacteroidaceae bacterium]
MRALNNILHSRLATCPTDRNSRMSAGRSGLPAWVQRMLLVLLFTLSLASCIPEPPLHLYDKAEPEIEIPIVDLDLEVYWDYEITFGITLDWRLEWYYGWDEEDIELYGALGYSEPEEFYLNRYYTGDIEQGPRLNLLSSIVEGNHFQAKYDWGFWDLLCWNNIKTLDGVQSIIFEQSATTDSVVARTNQSMNVSRYNAPRYTHAFYEPEPLFSAFERGVKIDPSLEGFEYDAERNVWVKRLDMELRPITYIYLTQIVLHNNNGRVASIDGNGNLSGMARSTLLNTGMAGNDPVTVSYRQRMKKNIPYVPYSITSDSTAQQVENPELVDVIGGRVLSFGLCNHNGNTIKNYKEVHDNQKHFIDVNMQFNNGMDSTMVFDVTEQVRRRYKGGVITIELDMDTVPIPIRRGGSGFDAVVKDFEDGGTHEFEM